MTAARFGGVSRETLVSSTGVLELAGTARETLYTLPGVAYFGANVRQTLFSGALTTKAAFFGVARETLLSETKARFSGLAREALVSSTGVLQVSAVARETLVSANGVLFVGGLARETLRTGSLTIQALMAGVAREVLLVDGASFVQPPFFWFIE